MSRTACCIQHHPRSTATTSHHKHKETSLCAYITTAAIKQYTFTKTFNGCCTIAKPRQSTRRSCCALRSFCTTAAWHGVQHPRRTGTHCPTHSRDVGTAVCTGRCQAKAWHYTHCCSPIVAAPSPAAAVADCCCCCAHPQPPLPLLLDTQRAHWLLRRTAVMHPKVLQFS